MATKRQRTTAYYWLRNVIPYIVFLLLIVTSCSADAGKSNTPPSPAISNPVYRQLVAIDVEIDTPPNYSLGHEVAVALANKIDELAARVNSAGLVIFACRISSMSWQDCPISFKTPEIEKWVLPPLDPAAHCSPDPYQCSKQKNQYKHDYATWVVIHAGQERAFDQVRAHVQQQTSKIRDGMKFQWDNKGSDIWNALATCAANLQGIDTPYKFCVLATDFISTTQPQGTLSLAGVRLVSVFEQSSDNAFSQQSTASWSTVARRAGAMSYTSYSVSQSQAFGLELPALPA